MANRSKLATATMAFAFVTMIPGLYGKEVECGATRDDASASDGIRTDRLTPRQLQTWRLIQQIVEAVDRTGRPLHPRLSSLWQWAQSSGNTIYIEILDEKNPQTYHAGLLTVQEPNGRGTGRTAVIQFWSSIIERASAQKEVRRADGFVPFEGLGRIERYAQVLGHELTHAALQLQDPVYDQMCRDLETEKAAFLASRKQNVQGVAYDQSSRERLSRILSLSEQIESPAQKAEAEIWRELRDGQHMRAAAR
jgi:hypothetical protein